LPAILADSPSPDTNLTTSPLLPDDRAIHSLLMREILGDSLRSIRIAQGRTLRDVSRSARISLGYLSEIERGVKEASSELLAAIAWALDVPLSRIVFDVAERLAQTEVVEAWPPLRRAA
jgi:transcriptional regulator with XRE-family HTH domain